MNLPEAGQDEVLEKLATDATCTDHEDSCLGPVSAIALAWRKGMNWEVVFLGETGSPPFLFFSVRTYLFDPTVQRAE